MCILQRGKTNAVNFISVYMPQFWGSVKLHHISSPGTIFKRYRNIIKYKMYFE